MGKMEVPRYVGASCCTVCIATVAADVVDIVVVRVNDINHIWHNVLAHLIAPLLHLLYLGLTFV
jgi:hypothetical protein